MAEYLAIDGWGEFQPLRGKGSWIKDATDQNDKPKLSGLSMFARGVLQELRRVRGRTGKNIPMDMAHIARATHTIATDRAHLYHAIHTLIARGILVVTNQEFDVLERGEKEIENEREKEKENKPPARKLRGEKIPDIRFNHCVEILHRYWDRFVKERVKFEIWMDKAGYKQLKNSLRRSEALSVEDFTRCVANRARSPGVDHFEPAYKWLGRVTDWAGGPKQANGKAKLTEQQSREGTSAAVAAAMGKVFGRTDAVGGEHVPLATAAKSGNTS